VLKEEQMHFSGRKKKKKKKKEKNYAYINELS
jgi:hypothetical protein